MEYVSIRQSLFVQINRSDELSVWRIKRSQLYSPGLTINFSSQCQVSGNRWLHREWKEQIDIELES